MSTTTTQRLLPRTVAAGALALGLLAGGYGITTAAGRRRVDRDDHARNAGTSHAGPVRQDGTAGLGWPTQRRGTPYRRRPCVRDEGRDGEGARRHDRAR